MGCVLLVFVFVFFYCWSAGFFFGWLVGRLFCLGAVFLFARLLFGTNARTDRHTPTTHLEQVDAVVAEALRELVPALKLHVRRADADAHLFISIVGGEMTKELCRSQGSQKNWGGGRRDSAAQL